MNTLNLKLFEIVLYKGGSGLFKYKEKILPGQNELTLEVETAKITQIIDSMIIVPKLENQQIELTTSGSVTLITVSCSAKTETAVELSFVASAKSWEHYYVLSNSTTDKNKLEMTIHGKVHNNTDKFISNTTIRLNTGKINEFDFVRRSDHEDMPSKKKMMMSKREYQAEDMPTMSSPQQAVSVDYAGSNISDKEFPAIEKCSFKQGVSKIFVLGNVKFKRDVEIQSIATVYHDSHETMYAVKNLLVQYAEDVMPGAVHVRMDQIIRDAEIAGGVKGAVEYIKLTKDLSKKITATIIDTKPTISVDRFVDVKGAIQIAVTMVTSHVSNVVMEMFERDTSALYLFIEKLPGFKFDYKYTGTLSINPDGNEIVRNGKTYEVMAFKNHPMQVLKITQRKIETLFYDVTEFFENYNNGNFEITFQHDGMKTLLEEFYAQRVKNEKLTPKVYFDARRQDINPKYFSAQFVSSSLPEQKTKTVGLDVLSKSPSGDINISL